MLPTIIWLSSCKKYRLLRIWSGRRRIGLTDGCTKVYVFSTAGSPAEDYCNDPAHGNCVFVKEGN